MLMVNSGRLGGAALIGFGRFGQDCGLWYFRSD